MGLAGTDPPEDPVFLGCQAAMVPWGPVPGVAWGAAVMPWGVGVARGAAVVEWGAAVVP